MAALRVGVRERAEALSDRLSQREREVLQLVAEGRARRRRRLRRFSTSA
jgi:DNA-binding CsgD family transcriptional regulator